jgi:hypothetical protein
LSFLEERAERADQPRRGAARRPPRGPSGDQQAIRARRLTALGVGIVVLILLVIGVKACLSSQKEQAFKDYVTSVKDITQQSNNESKQFFGLLSNPGSRGPVDLQTTVSQYSNDASQLVDRAKRLDHPDELGTSQRYLVETLEFRRDGLSHIAAVLPTALGDTGRAQASLQIAGYMQDFLASDVIYSQRFLPNLQGAVKKEGVLGAVSPLPQSRFLNDLGWISPAVVAGRISRIRGGGTSGPVAPGLHGTGLGTVTVKPSGTTLAPGSAAQIKASPNLSFDVQVMDQGTNDEKDVTVRVSITGAGKPVVVEKRITSIAAGQTQIVNVPLAATPPTGRPVTIQVQTLPVPGEKNTTNNKSSFPAIFSP